MRYPNDNDEMREWLDICNFVIAGKSRSYVADSGLLARKLKEMIQLNKELNDNLSRVQARCTELLEEKRALSSGTKEGFISTDHAIPCVFPIGCPRCDPKREESKDERSDNSTGSQSC